MYKPAKFKNFLEYGRVIPIEKQSYSLAPKMRQPLVTVETFPTQDGWWNSL